MVASRKNGTPLTMLPRLTSEQEPNQIQVKLGYHWLIAGITGAGKTTLARELVKVLIRLAESAGLYQWRLFILDGLNVGDYDGFANHVLDEEAPSVRMARGQRVQVWHPLLELPGEQEKWLRE